MTADDFRGVGVALVTPFRSDGALDETALESLVDLHADSGTDFLVPCGTTGENPALSDAEHRRVVEITVRRSAGRIPVLAGAGSNSTTRAIELAIAAADLGADGILTITPFYNKPNPDGMRRHFAAQAEQLEKHGSRLPMILYNVPGRTGINMTADLTLRIARETPLVAGVKEASGNLEQILEILRLCTDEFLVLSGDDAWTLPLIAAGADGVISVIANEIPRLFAGMVHAALDDDYESARIIHNRILPLMTGNFIESNPVPAKTVMKMLNLIPDEHVRLPLAPISTANRERLAAILRECEIEVTS